MTTNRETNPATKPWKRILIHELIEYFFNFAFLAIFLVAFAWYRRLILAAHGIHYLGYWAPLIEAAILAKVIMIGDALRIGRQFQNQPLAVTTLYRTVVFSLFVIFFSFAEHIIGALIHGKRPAEGIAEIANKGLDEVLAWCVLMAAAFLPFFALKEIDRVLGTERLRRMFFSKHWNEPHSSTADKSQTGKDNE